MWPSHKSKQESKCNSFHLLFQRRVNDPYSQKNTHKRFNQHLCRLFFKMLIDLNLIRNSQLNYGSRKGNDNPPPPTSKAWVNGWWRWLIVTMSVLFSLDATSEVLGCSENKCNAVLSFQHALEPHLLHHLSTGILLENSISTMHSIVSYCPTGSYFFPVLPTLSEHYVIYFLCNKKMAQTNAYLK